MTRSTWIASLILATMTLAVPADAQPITVDCGAGGDLAQAIEAAAAGGPSDIRIIGTCVGPFTVATGDVRLRGISPGRSAIEGEAFFPVLEVRAGASIRLDSLDIRGGIFGVFVSGPGARVGLFDSAVHDNDLGLLITDGAVAFLNGSEIRNNEVGVSLNHRASIQMLQSSVRDNTISGVTAFDQSRVEVALSEVHGHGDVGLIVGGSSLVILDQAKLSNNATADLIVRDRSRLDVWAASVIGSADERGELAVAILERSAAYLGDEAAVFGGLLAGDSSYIALRGSDVSGSIELDEFSNLVLSDADVLGAVRCRGGADATCGSGARARTDGCRSAPTICDPAHAVGRASEPSGLDRLRESLDPVGDNSMMTGTDFKSVPVPF